VKIGTDEEDEEEVLEKEVFVVDFAKAAEVVAPAAPVAALALPAWF